MTILIVDDSVEDRTTVREFLDQAAKDEGLVFDYLEAGLGEHGLAAAVAQTPECILLDYYLPDMSGIEFLDRLKTGTGEMPLPIVMLTGSTDRSLPGAALRAGSQEYLPKQFLGPEMLLRSIRSSRNRFSLIAERQRTERALASSENMLRLSQEAGGIASFEQDFRSGMIRWAAGSQGLLGFPADMTAMTGAEWQSALHPHDARTIVAQEAAMVAARETRATYEARLLAAGDGAMRRIEIRLSIEYDAAGQPTRSNAAVIDVTEQRAATEALASMNNELDQRVRERTALLAEEARRRSEAETRLLQAEKMEAIGHLTGGIAHDFNNMLQAIIGNLELALRQTERSGEDFSTPALSALASLRAPIDGALFAAQRASQITHRLLAYARRQTLDAVAIDTAWLVGGMDDLVRRTLGDRVSVITVFEDGLWPALVDANQLEAAILNLVVNSRDAMPLGGDFLIEGANICIGHEAAGRFGDLPAGEYVRLTFSDTGSGIADAILPNVFEPFFTTKDVGHGTGLGLAMVYGFAKQSGGCVHITSKPGEGTAVALHLPRAAALRTPDAVAPPASITIPDVPAATPATECRATIMIVEDDPEVRAVVEDSLIYLGYKVIAVADAIEAVRQLETRQGRGVDLLFTDIGLPGGMSGRDLARLVAVKWPSLPVLLTSGYCHEAGAPDTAAGAHEQVLSKPYSLSDLSREIREALNGAQAERATGSPSLRW